MVGSVYDLVGKMIQPGIRLLSLLIVGLFGGADARAQDSFVRVGDAGAGRASLSVLGTGIGRPYAVLSLDMRCPQSDAWLLTVRGVSAEAGTPMVVGFLSPGGRWVALPFETTDYGATGIEFRVSRAAYREALAASRAGRRPAGVAQLRVIIGDTVGIAVERDALVREMTDFARDCDAARGGRRAVAGRGEGAGAAQPR